MKNLIEKIEKIIISLKRQYQNCFEEIDCPLFTSDEIKGKISAYQDCLILLNQYNIITAPKQIKLSEIVNKLKNAFVDLGNIDYEGFIEIGYGFITLNDEIVITIDLDSQKIVLIEFTNTFIELKWLYTLWIAGTEIIDDLGVDLR